MPSSQESRRARAYSPYVNMEASLSRRRVVLQRMVDVGYIDQDTANKAAQEPVNLVGLNREKDNTARYVSFMVRDYLLKRYGADAVYRGGLTVKTTIDLNLQRAAEKAIAELLPTGRTEDRNGVTMEYPQAALVSISAQTGQIKALVGGRGNDEFNRAIMAERSPGSAIKPFCTWLPLRRASPRPPSWSMSLSTTSRETAPNGARPTSTGRSLVL